ncbi:serine hydrolase [Phenylobacterium terrae]|uniref:Serine hydrolase n=1 Tax=Phenylobacterium terrae TaxID=2665495 RepID=A0ABW4N3S4_9CAUL
MDISRRAFQLAGLSAWLGGAAAAQPGSAPDEARIGAILRERVDEQKKAVGLVVGRLTPAGVSFDAYGARGRHSNGRTVFRIASLTKLFTALLLADMATRGEVGLDEPVSDHLPPELRLPTSPGRPITFADLATHTAGLPFRAPDQAVGPGAPPYRLEQLQRFLAGLTLEEPPGQKWLYSNVGYALLGQALSQRAGARYTVLLRERIAFPLGLQATAVVPARTMRSRLATGHDEDLRPLPPSRFEVMAPSGGLWSCAADLVRFLSAFTDPASPLSRAAALMLAATRPAPGLRAQQALGWEVHGQGEAGYLSKDGLADDGFTAAIVCDPPAGRGVVVLSNTAIGVSDIARHLLRPDYPLAKAYRITTLPAEALGRYVGRYQAPTGAVFVVSTSDVGLLLQIPGAPLMPIAPTGADAFVQPQVGVEVDFRIGPDGRPAGFVLRSAGRPPLEARRIE